MSKEPSVFQDLAFEERLRAQQMLSPKEKRAKLAALERSERKRKVEVESGPVVINRSAWDVLQDGF